MKKIILFIFTLIPSVTFAQQLKDINSVALKATNIGNLVIALLISLSVVWIIISIVRYFIAGGPDAKKEGGWAVFYGVLGLFLILSIWGFVYLLKDSFVFSDTARPSFENIGIPDPVKTGLDGGKKGADGTTLIPGVNGPF